MLRPPALPSVTAAVDPKLAVMSLDHGTTANKNTAWLNK